MGVYDASAGVIRLHVDGGLPTETAFAGGFNAGGVLRMGRVQGGAGPLFGTGVVDDVRVFPGPLSNSQVTAIFFDQR